MKDFFVSYTANDEPWAEWIAWQLEQAGYSTVLQAWPPAVSVSRLARPHDQPLEAQRHHRVAAQLERVASAPLEGRPVGADLGLGLIEGVFHLRQLHQLRTRRRLDVLAARPQLSQ